MVIKGSNFYVGRRKIFRDVNCKMSFFILAEKVWDDTFDLLNEKVFKKYLLILNFLLANRNFKREIYKKFVCIFRNF